MAKPKKKPKAKAKRTTKGPESLRLKIEGDWIDAIDQSLKVKRPPGGWPKP